MKILSLLAVSGLLHAANSYKVLVVFQMPMFSHFRLGSTLAKGLADAGHDVTLVSPFENKMVPKNGSLTEVLLSINGTKNYKFSTFFDLADIGTFINILRMSNIGNARTKETFEDPSFQQLINSDETFDVIIIEQFVNDGLKALSCHYNAPLIMFSAIGANAWLNAISGNPSPPSYIPESIVEYGSSMNFMQRTKNSLVVLFHELCRYFIMSPAQNEMVKLHFPNCPSVEALSRNVSLFFLNYHESFGQAVPLVPNIINIGGFHVNPPKKLPKDLQQILDNASDGVIFFSLGSLITPSHMKPEKKQALIYSLGGLKETVLWKWDEELSDNTDNVVVRKWFPQMDILAHPNVKLFITHGGLLSTIESIYHGVPILVLPVFADQKLNAARAVEFGYGVSLHFDLLTKETFSLALNEALNNQTYRETAKQRSALLHDRPMKPMDLAVYWTEFVARHRGAPHLRVAAVDMPWYKYFLIDVIALISIIIFTVLAAMILLLRKVCYRRLNFKLKKN